MRIDPLRLMARALVVAGFGVMILSPVLAATKVVAWPPDNLPKVTVKRSYQPAFYFGYGPDRLIPEEAGWIAHVGKPHSTEFELRADRVRVTVGYGSGFMRSYLGGLDDFPGVGRPGRIILRARRDRSQPRQHIKMMVVSNERHWEWRIEKDVVFDWFRKDDKESKDHRLAWPNEQWEAWHDYVVTFTGAAASVSIDNDPALTLPLKIDRGEGRLGAFYISIGGTMDWVEVQSIRFVGMEETVITPEPEAKIPDGVFRRNYANGQPCVETTYAGGVEHGGFLSWWPDGRKQGEGRFAQGIKQGVWKRWFPSGQIAWERPFKDGLPDGTVTQWAFDGKGGYRIDYQGGRRGASVEWTLSPVSAVRPGAK